jgi:hypothetical protein
VMSFLRLARVNERWLTAALAFAVALLFVLMCLRLPMRLDGDQSLYFFGARQMSQGMVLYRDFWDIKPPGVYAFYWVAGTLFGYSAVGLHILELIWLSLAAVLIYRLCSIATGGSRLALLGPFFTVGAYFVAATPWHLTQPDGLLTLPLTFSAWAISEPRFRRGNPVLGWILAGVGAGFSAMFVTASALVVFAFVATAALVTMWTVSPDVRISGAKRLGGFLLGLGAFLLIPVLWFASLGALADYVWTTVSYPVAAQAEFSRDIPKLVGSVRWFLEAVELLIPCALIGGLATLREARVRDSSALVGLLMCTWFVGGFAALLLQYHYSWQFHFNHFFVPAGIFTVIGLAEVVRVMRNRDGRVLSIALLILALGFPLLLVKKVLLKGDVDLSAQTYEDSVKRGLAAAASGDSLYVLGDPRVLFAAGHSQPVKENGWALEVLLPDQWKDFSESLRESRPVYIYVTRGYPELLARNAPELQDWISRDYVSIHTDDVDGTWYRRRDLTPPIRTP